MKHRAARGSLIAGLVLAACSSSSPSAVDEAPTMTGEFANWITATSRPRNSDRFEVWICRVPLDTAVEIYEPGATRLALQPDAIAAQLTEHVGQYFATISLGVYAPRFVAGGAVELGPTDDSQRCAAEAADRSDAAATAVLLVADAEHRADAPGGWGRPNNAGCPQPSCSARASRRAVYVGAADFHPDWGDAPALDLIEHEIGHSLGWPHSTAGEVDAEAVNGTAGEHASPIDLMSDSAAPRRTDATRRDGPDVLALERLLSGWIDAATIADITSTTARVTLVPSSADRAVAGPRLAVRSTGRHRFVTIEAIVAEGMNSHLASDGIAVHLVDLTASPVLPVVQAGGLLGPGSAWTLDDITVSVVSPTQIEITTSVAPLPQQRAPGNVSP